ncbi:MAG: LuxR C-terminal-related transcriptional regulator [Pseudomonadota bacterium]
MELNRFSRLTYDLHEASHALAAERFQDWAIERLHRDLPFCSAWWGVATLADRGGTILDSHCYGMRPGFAQEFETIRECDDVGARMIDTLGVTAYKDGHSIDPALRRFDARHGLHSIMATAVPDSSGALMQFLTLFRPESARPFSAGERALKEALVPHLMQAWRANWDGVPAAAGDEPAALLATDGRVIDADVRFMAMLRAAWPAWCGRRIVLCNEGAAGFEGPRAAMAVIRIVPSPGGAPGTQRVVVRSNRCGALAPRERAVAEHYAAGLSYKEIAKEMTLSPATVRSYLKTCYDKLAVGNKVQLQQALGMQTNYRF